MRLKTTNIHRTALENLEFSLVLDQVSSYCITPSGIQKILDSVPFKKIDEIVPELQRVKEFKDSFNNDNPIPNHGFESIDKELNRLNIENSSLEISGFRKILSIDLTVLSLKKYFKKYEEYYLHLHPFSEEVKYMPQISKEIQKVIDRYGEVKDDASELLSSIRSDLRKVRKRIQSSFSKALKSYDQSGYLDEIKESIVDNRRVLAVSAMYRKKIQGTALGSSKTGSIVYMEPQETLEHANELANLIYDEDQEIKRILKDLTDVIRPYSDMLNSYQDYLTHIDAMFAKASYANEINGVLPLITAERELHLIKAYHPLLYTENKKRKAKTYPQTIHLHPENRIIIISGPNAGGKSITLKTIGLLQIMLQSGFLIPVDPFSEVCIFYNILTDIGDHQSIENHLSTYSYRLKLMNQFLKRCKTNTLFLIDEFGTGSDPELGGALAETFLEVFYENMAYGVITTHYTNLKLLANELPHATNANMQFNNRTLEPMFQLHLGEAGSSFTFEVAQKNGIPYSLINKAKKKIERGKIRFDRSIANLQKERFQLRKTSKVLKDTEEKARLESKQLEETNERIQEKLESYQELYDTNQRYISLGRKLDILAEKYQKNKRKKALIDEIIKMVMVENSKRKKVSESQKRHENIKRQKIVKEVEKKVKVIRERKKKEKELAKKLPPPKPREILKIGDRVRMLDGIAVGTIDQIEKKKAIVNYGTFTTNIAISELEKVL
jgi:DNA mismatch repair protein MutS2